MKCLLSVCLVSLACLAVAARNMAPGGAQALRQGVSVQMAVTANAAPMPEADSTPWIVSVTNNGALYFGIHPVTPDALVQEMKSRPREREQKLYVKADARAAYANVRKAIEAGRKVSFETVALLTSQPSASAPGGIVSPRGLDVSLLSPDPSAEPILVQMHHSKRAHPELQINHQPVPWSALQITLIPLLQSQKQKLVQLQVDGMLPFADVVELIDTCRANGATVILPASGV